MPDLFNQKIKTYPNGKRIIIYCNKPIFSPKKDEEDGATEFAFDNVDDVNIDDDSENENEKEDEKEDEKEKQPDIVNICRSMARAKARIFDIAFCNDWSYFLTITWDDSVIDSRNVREVMKKLSAWLNDRSKRDGLIYMIIPEYHKSGRIHMHGLINDALAVVDSGTRTVKGFDKPVKLSTIRAMGLSKDVQDIVYNVPAWKYGFSTAVKIHGDPGALATYVTKYMTKATTKVFGKYYWSSADLVREPEISYGSVPWFDSIRLDEFCVPNTDIRLKYRTDMFISRD